MTWEPIFFDDDLTDDVLAVLHRLALAGGKVPTRLMPGRLGDIAEVTYRRHITTRAAEMRVTERNLSYAVAWQGVLRQIEEEAS